jgi:hypothetical protein
MGPGGTLAEVSRDVMNEKQIILEWKECCIWLLVFVISQYINI